MGILKTAATVAVASSVHGRIQRRQQARWAAQDQASAAAVPATPPPYPVPPQSGPVGQPEAAAANDRLAQLKQLGELLSAGVLTQAEFEHEKSRILHG